MWVREFEIIKFAKELQPSKAPNPMCVTEFRMVKFAKELQPSKAQCESQSLGWSSSPMSGNSQRHLFQCGSQTKRLQQSKADRPMWVTEFGMITLAKVWQALKAFSPI